MILIVLAFVAGIATVLSPCVLPIVPLLAGAAATGGSRRIGWILGGFALAFVGTTVVLASTLAALGITTSAARTVAAIVLAGAGLTVAVPMLMASSERAGGWVAGPVARFAPSASRASGPASAVLLGGLIGLLWAPCVGPIMAAVIATSALAGPTADGIAIAIAYVAGTSLTIGAILLTGRRVADRLGPRRRDGIRRSIGVAMLATALLIATGMDLPVQARLAALLPTSFELDRAGSDGSEGSEMAQGVRSEDGEIDGLTADVALADLGPAPELTGITAWLNSEPLTLAALRGRVVLVHFWTFGCINCLHVQPYVKAWSDRYSDAGLVVIGVHTPELSYERDLANVRQAVADDDVRFPVAFDPDFATWQAYGNHYWPAFYFIDRAGVIRHTHFGEGDYEGSEAVIRALLADPG